MLKSQFNGSSARLSDSGGSRRPAAEYQGEIIDGVLYTMTRPRGPHQSTAPIIGTDLLGPFQRGRGGPGGWWILPELGIELASTPEIAPDLAGWRRERLPILPEDSSITVVPDWVCVPVRTLMQPPYRQGHAARGTGRNDQPQGDSYRARRPPTCSRCVSLIGSRAKSSTMGSVHRARSVTRAARAAPEPDRPWLQDTT